MEDQKPDFLDEMITRLAEGDRTQLDEWEATKLVALMVKTRRDRGLTQTEVAQRMGVAQQHVARLENRPWSVSFSRVVAYARAVGVEVGIVGDLIEAT